jgi:hypothetical protein
VEREIMEKLTIQNELRVLQKAFTKNEYIGKGSSRAVYGLDEKTILKVVADSGGKLQNKLEAETYAKHKSDKLAKIYAVGKFILVMERVNLIDDYDDYNDDDEREFNTVQDYLNCITGTHGDNYQIGKSLDGHMKAYDYGYTTIKNIEQYEMIGDIGYYLSRYGKLGLIEETKKKLIKAIFG